MPDTPRCSMHGCHEEAGAMDGLCAPHRHQLLEAEAFERGKASRRLSECIWPGCVEATHGIYCDDHRRAARRATWRRAHAKKKAAQAAVS